MSSSKIIKAIAVIFVIIFGLAEVFIGGFIYLTEFQKTDIDASVSMDGTYEAVFQSVGEPDFPFGYSHGRLLLKKNHRTVTDYRFDVGNDGKILLPDNWKVVWKKNAAEITIYGEEQYDHLYILYFDGSVEEWELNTGFGEE